MSNSSLVTYTKISPKKSSPRKHSIDTIKRLTDALEINIQTDEAAIGTS